MEVKGSDLQLWLLFVQLKQVLYLMSFLSELILSVCSLPILNISKFFLENFESVRKSKDAFLSQPAWILTLSPMR